MGNFFTKKSNATDSLLFNQPNTTGSSSVSFSRVLLITIVVIILYLIYKYYRTNSKSKTLVRSHNAKDQISISDGSLPRNRSTDYTYSIWYYIDNWNYKIGQDKILFGRVTNNKKPSPVVMFAPNNNDLLIKLDIYPNKKNTESKIFTCNVTNVPLQKWTNVIISIENRALDVYLDGKLVKTCIMPGVPKVSSSNILLTPNGGFSGYTNLFEYFAYPVNPTRAYSIYKSGLRPSFNLGLDRYKFKMSFLKDNTEIRSLEI